MVQFLHDNNDNAEDVDNNDTRPQLYQYLPVFSKK